MIFIKQEKKKKDLSAKIDQVHNVCIRKHVLDSQGFEIGVLGTLEPDRIEFFQFFTSEVMT